MVKSNKKIKVLQVIPSMQSGGVERGVMEISKALFEDEDFEIIVASNGGKMVDKLNFMGIKHIKLPLHTKNPFRIWKNIAKLVKIIKEEEIDILHARSRAPAWSAYFACKKTGCKFVTTVHGSYSMAKGIFSPLKKLYNSSMLMSDLIITVSNFISEFVIENYKEAKERKGSIVVIHRGVDLETFHPEKIGIQRILRMQEKLNLPEDKDIIMLPGRFTEWKGHEFLIDALKKVKNDFFCIMIGDDKGHKEYRKRLEKKIIESKLNKKVRLEQNTDDMPATYMFADIVVSASVRPEAFGRVSVEAQAMKKNVIATAIGGSLETIIDEKTGWLVSSTDPEHLAQKIDFVLSMPKDQREKIAENGRKNIQKNFSTKKMCDQTLEAYKQLISKKHASK